MFVSNGDTSWVRADIPVTIRKNGNCLDIHWFDGNNRWISVSVDSILSAVNLEHGESIEGRGTWDSPANLRTAMKVMLNTWTLTGEA